jgi:uncharacterized membrane protein
MNTSRLRFHASRFTLLTILLLASFLRFYRLDAQSFWNDEGNSARIAERTVRLIVEGAAGDIHPPGYYLLLHAWRTVCGQSEFALRAFSAFAGVLTVAFVYAWGCRLFGAVTGLLAGFLAAVSPLAVYYSQEARMYALLGMLSVASTYQVCKWTSRQVGKFASSQSLIPDPQSLVTYTLLVTLGLYTQYAFVFVLLVHNVVFGLWWLLNNRHWRRLAVWVSAQAAIVVLYLPWLPVALRATGWPSAEMTVGLGRALLDVLRVLAVGITLPLERATLALVGSGVLLLVGLWPRKGGWFSVLVAALYLLLAIAFILAFDLYKPAWLKFLIVVLPPFHILVAQGVENLVAVTGYAIRSTQYKARIAYCVFCVLLLAICAYPVCPSLRNLYFNPAYARDDYRQIAADIAAAYHRGDAVILNAPNQWEVFTYYYPDRDVHPAPYHPTPEQAETFLAPLVRQYRRLFVLYWGDTESDPQRLIETWLAFHTYKAADRWYGRVRLATYGVAALPEKPAITLDARFGDAIRLQGYALGGESFAPGDVLPVTLFWEAEAGVPARYKVTVQLLDGAGQLVAQHDGEPADGLAPTDGWQPGRRALDRHGITLPGDLLPGPYPLAVALYHIASGERLPVTLDGEPVGDLLVLTGVEVGE